MVSIISQDMVLKKTEKQVKKAEARDFIQHAHIPSYIEVRLDNKKNVKLLDRHLRYILNPYLDSVQHHAEEKMILYKPLFEYISFKPVKKKYKKKEGGDNWVERLAYN